MDPGHRRSKDVIETCRGTRAELAATSAWERFEALYRSSRDDVYAYVTTLLRDRAAAEDVTALAFERAYRRRRTFDRRRGEERAWLFGIARNAALDELRRRRAAGHAGDRARGRRPSRPSRTTPTSRCAGPPCARRWRRCRPREREIVALKFHGGLSEPELAQVLGVSESNAGTMLHRTMQKLRKACDATN